MADGLDSNDEEVTLHIRGTFNELPLRDLRKKTLRGQMGRKQRGFSVGVADGRASEETWSSYWSKQRTDRPTYHGGAKCFFANARPDPDFKYFSNRLALS